MSIQTSYKHSKSLKHNHNENSKQTDQHLVPTTQQLHCLVWENGLYSSRIYVTLTCQCSVLISKENCVQLNLILLFKLTTEKVLLSITQLSYSTQDKPFVASWNDRSSRARTKRQDFHTKPPFAGVVAEVSNSSPVLLRNLGGGKTG